MPRCANSSRFQFQYRLGSVGAVGRRRLGFFQRAVAATFAISAFCSADNFAALAAPPFAPPALPRATAFSDLGFVSSISPVVIRMMWTALATTSAGRFSPLGPLGMENHRHVAEIEFPSLVVKRPSIA